MQTEAEFFRELAPAPLRRALCRLVFDGCLTAYELAEQHDKSFRLDAVTAHRRLAVEGALSNLILPAGFRSEVFRTPSTHYTQISSARVAITAVTRAQEPDFINPYRYRANLARASQISLFTLLQETPPELHPDEKLYALLVYGGPHRAKLPTIAKIVFPMPNGMVPRDSVNLLEDHADLVNAYRKEHASDLPEAELKLRKKPATKEG